MVHASDDHMQLCASRALYAMLHNDVEPMELVLPTLLQLYQDMLYVSSTVTHSLTHSLPPSLPLSLLHNTLFNT